MRSRRNCRRRSGFWSQFWMKNESGKWPPEIDVFELLSKHPNKLQLTQHWKDASRGHQQNYGFDQDADFTQDWHTYAVDWEPNSMTWYIDGQPKRRVTSHIPQDPMFIVLDLTVDGRSFDLPDGNTKFPRRWWSIIAASISAREAISNADSSRARKRVPTTKRPGQTPRPFPCGKAISARP